MNNNPLLLEEPNLIFGYGQTHSDPKVGLSLFGPLESENPKAITVGVIGTAEGVKHFKNWLKRLQRPINGTCKSIIRPLFPGFEAAYNCRINDISAEIIIDNKDIESSLSIADNHKRIYQTVSIYSDKIIEKTDEIESQIHEWIVIVPDLIHKLCRPQSFVREENNNKKYSKRVVSYLQTLDANPSFFPEFNTVAGAYEYELNFHNQLKFRLLEKKVTTQIIRESTLKFSIPERERQFGERIIDHPSTVAWNLTSTIFYKAGGKPWKLSNIRKGVCYIGVVFKLLQDTDKNACCAAQMFLDSGEGYVFRGAIGPWYNKDKDDFHLTKDAAKELIERAMKTYFQETGYYPSEVFIHGKTRFNYYEWEGLLAGCPASTNVVTIQIRHASLKLFGVNNYPVLRGILKVEEQRQALLWTKGFIASMKSYPGFEVPNPISIGIVQGDCDIVTVAKDILALTKLNYNSCVYSDGMPITIKFANAIGEILTSGKIKGGFPLPFKYYI